MKALYPHAPISVGAVLNCAIDRLTRAGIEASRFEAKVIAAHVLDTEPGAIVSSRQPVSAIQSRTIDHLVSLRANRMPLNYVIGSVTFMGLHFKVDARALSPRPETELLAEMFIHRVARHQSTGGTVIDIGCGSGVLGLSVAHELPQLSVVGADISRAALQLFLENATALGLTGRVSAVRGSFLEWLAPEAAGRIEYVISNPPYVRPDVYSTLAPEIVSYEPRAALVSPTPDGLGAYRSIATTLGMMDAVRLVGLEIGYDQAEVLDIMRQARADLIWRVHNDYSGHPRIVIGEADG